MRNIKSKSMILSFLGSIILSMAPVQQAAMADAVVDELKALRDNVPLECPSVPMADTKRIQDLIQSLITSHQRGEARLDHFFNPVPMAAKSSTVTKASEEDLAAPRAHLENLKARLAHLRDTYSKESLIRQGIKSVEGSLNEVDEFLSDPNVSKGIASLQEKIALRACEAMVTRLEEEMQPPQPPKKDGFFARFTKKRGA